MSSDVTVLSTEWAVAATAIASKEIHFHFHATIFIDWNKPIYNSDSNFSLNERLYIYIDVYMVESKSCW